MVDEIYKMLGKNRLHDLGFDIPKGEVTHQEAVVLDKAKASFYI